MAKRVLTESGFGGAPRRRLVSIHVDVFTDLSAPGRAGERRDHFEALFDALVDGYRAGLMEGKPEAGARECVHIMANLDFWAHGWMELMEFPAAELGPHLDRRRDFFDAHGVTRETPLGEFRPVPFPDAPATPARRDDPTYPNAEAGYADDVYVRDGQDEIHAGADRPEPDLGPADLHEFIREMESKYDVRPSFTGGDGRPD